MQWTIWRIQEGLAGTRVRTEQCNDFQGRSVLQFTTSAEAVSRFPQMTALISASGTPDCWAGDPKASEHGESGSQILISLKSKTIRQKDTTYQAITVTLVFCCHCSDRSLLSGSWVDCCMKSHLLANVSCFARF